jgi:ferredoxin
MKRHWWQFLVKPSTVAFTREAHRSKNLTLFDFLHGYVYARWPYLYIGIGTGEHRLAKVIGPSVDWISRHWPGRKNNQDRAGEQNGKPQITFADTYHGKVVPLAAARQLVMVREAVRIENLERIIPYAKARDIILEDPDHIAVLDCPCRVSRPDPCLPLDVCLIVGEPFASFVVEHQPGRSRRITPGEAVEILQAEDARGHVHHAFFKDAMLGRFYAICNCCDCCCGAMQAQRHGTRMLAPSGYVAQVDESLCLGCGECAPFCQFGALSLDGFVSFVDVEKCMGCGVCVSKCENGGLSLKRSPEKGEPLEIFQLIAQSSRVNEPIPGGGL